MGVKRITKMSFPHDYMDKPYLNAVLELIEKIDNRPYDNEEDSNQKYRRVVDLRTVSADSKIFIEGLVTDFLPEGKPIKWSERAEYTEEKSMA